MIVTSPTDTSWAIWDVCVTGAGAAAAVEWKHSGVIRISRTICRTAVIRGCYCPDSLVSFLLRQ